MTEDTRSLITLIGLIVGSGLLTLLVIAAITYYLIKGDRRE